MNQTKPATEERLAHLFLKEVGEIISSGRTYTKTHDALIEYLAEVRLYGKRSDFHTATRFPDKNVFSLLIQPYSLHDSFKAWLRKQGIDPDRIRRTHRPGGRKKRL